jgi:hypothetical protein
MIDYELSFIICFDFLLMSYLSLMIRIVKLAT